jgi:23S rRNA pseudouridine1911/1915/1917 synthase
MPLTTKVLQITAETPPDVRKADRAVQSLAGTSRRGTAGLFHQQCVRLNGQVCMAPWQRLAIGDTIEVRFQPGQRYAPKKPAPRNLGFDILLEDEHVIVVNKPANCLTVPSPNRESNTLIQRIADYLKRSTRRRWAGVHAVHRLDRGVSGVLVFAKSAQAIESLRQQFRWHEPDREYLAIVAGRVEPAEGTFRSHLATSRSLQRYSTHNAKAGELAITHYRVEKLMKDTTLVRIRLETGRRNQIRVHFAEAGHPVLGDPRYERQRARHPRWHARRLALHAVALSFDHPITGERFRFEVPVPEEFRRFASIRQW